MEQLTRTKAIAYLAIVFVAGAVTGGVGGWKVAKGNRPPPPKKEDMAARWREDLKSRLDLTPAQVAKINPIIAQTTEELARMHHEGMKSVGAIFEKSNEQIRNELSPEQQVKFDKWQRERRSFMNKRPGGDRPGPPPRRPEDDPDRRGGGRRP